MRFEKSEDIFVTRKTWQERSEQPNESSLKNVFILDIFEIPEGEESSLIHVIDRFSHVIDCLTHIRQYE